MNLEKWGRDVEGSSHFCKNAYRLKAEQLFGEPKMPPNARFAPGHEQLTPGACGVYLQKRDAP
jgi:hypothetical protein